MTPHTRAQSEIIGVVLLTGVILLVTIGAGAVIISNMASQADDAPSVNIEGQATTQNVTIYHTGGNKLATSDIAVILDGEQRERYSLGEFTQEIGNDDTRFEPGDGWSHANEVGDDNIRILVVHEPSNSILDDLTVKVEVTLVAKFSYSPGKPTRNDTVTFDASASEINPESEINSYDWDINGTSKTGKTVDYNFSDIGEYPVTLTVTADDGRTANRTKSVRVYNAPPNPEFTYSPSSPGTGENITFNASASNDPDGSIKSYEWDFDDDGTVDATGETTSNSYGSEGNYTVRLNITDDDGASRRIAKTVGVGGDGGSTQLLEYRSPEKLDSGVVYFSVKNTADRSVTIEKFAIDATNIDSKARLDNGDSDEVKISPDSGTPGEAEKKNHYNADGNARPLDTNAIIDSGSESEIDMRLLEDKDGNTLSFDLEQIDNEADADVSVTLELSDGSDQKFYFEDVS